jgi:hypothetical protein
MELIKLKQIIDRMIEQEPQLANKEVLVGMLEGYAYSIRDVGLENVLEDGTLDNKQEDKNEVVLIKPNF